MVFVFIVAGAAGVLATAAAVHSAPVSCLHLLKKISLLKKFSNKNVREINRK